MLIDRFSYSQKSSNVNRLQSPQVNIPGKGFPAALHSNCTGLFTTTVSFSIFPASSRLGGSARSPYRRIFILKIEIIISFFLSSIYADRLGIKEKNTIK